MNPELHNEDLVEVVKEKHRVFQVTKTSKYLALLLFIILPFIGGYIGYTYAPEKMIEVQVEKVVEVKSKDLFREKYFSSYYINSYTEDIELDRFESSDLGVAFNYPKVWGQAIVSRIDDSEVCNDEYIGDCPRGVISFSGYPRPWTDDLLNIDVVAVTSEGKVGQRWSNEGWWLDFAYEYDSDYIATCEENENCQLIENESNIVVRKTFKLIDCYAGCENEESAMGYEYGVYNKNAPYQSVLMSAIYLKEEFNSAKPVESAFERFVIYSFEWINAE